MQLPFSHSAFLAVFGRYNAAFWPVAAVLWVASLIALVAILRRREWHPFISTVIATQWAWAGVAYHLHLFAEINPAAKGFGWAFVVQGVLVVVVGSAGGRLRYVAGGAKRAVGLSLAAYGLLYPLFAIVFVHSYPETPTFGVPCPTVLYTAGLLLLATPRRPVLLVVPLLWGFIGGSAAILLGIVTDYPLLMAGVVLLADLVAPRLLWGRGDSERKLA